MNIHILACGGAVMHNIALALNQLGHHISGSDDEIFEPALSRLKKANICPESFGWFPEKITQDLDFIILGMHARSDNPELLKAKELGVKIYSFPEYVYEHAKNKIRVVIGGSHGKTTTTAMVMHVLKTLNKDFDYLVGSQLEGFDTMVRFSDAPLMVIEGDEYLTSTLDPIPKFLKYKPQIAMITGIAWDHINVFPTWENYVEQFELFVNSIDADGSLIYFDGDETLKNICENSKLKKIPYNTPHYHIRNNKIVVGKGERHTLEIFGEHNLQNAEGACLVCKELGIDEDEFYEALASFKGTAKRLEKVHEEKNLIVFRDFAHSPSKLKASIDAVRKQFSSHNFIAVFELHTFSSLNKDFLPNYQHSMDLADEALVYYNPEVFAQKKMQIIEKEDITKNFGSKVWAIEDSKELISKISEFKSNVFGKPCVILLMSSGNFDNAKMW
jgi:UDP-N-acetylmuramate: L-alanyl-gamma-D-glutamyl-meso-diaminopimelate ligase